MNLIKLANKAIDLYNDGETQAQDCIELYCKDHGYTQDQANEAYKLWFIEEAVSHGIPRSVAMGKSSLKDHFSQEYINWKCNKEEL